MKVYMIRGRKCYPLCSWEKNQHKFYNANDRAFLALCDARDAGDVKAIEKAESWKSLIEDYMSIFNNYVVNGIVYAPYPEYNTMKEIIVAYDVRH